MSICVIKRDSDGFYRTVMMRWSPSVRLAARYEGTPWSADKGTAWVKLRVKAVPAPDAHDILYRLAGIEADGVGVILGWPEAGPADETLTDAARRVVAERDALKSKLVDTENKLATMSLTLQGVESFRVTAIRERDATGDELDAAVAKATLLQDKYNDQSRSLADAIRERDAAVSDGDQQRERAKKAEDRMTKADGTCCLHRVNAIARATLAESRLAALTLERDALRAKLDVETRNVSGLASSLTLVRQECSDAIRERDEAIVRAKAAEKALGEATALERATRALVGCKDAEILRLMKQRNEWARRHDDFRELIATVADQQKTTYQMAQAAALVGGGN